MIMDCKGKAEVENLFDYGKTVLVREARAMALLLVDNYFPCADKQADISCRNCQSFVNRLCSGKGLGYYGAIECMVNKAIIGADYPPEDESMFKRQL